VRLPEFAARGKRGAERRSGLVPAAEQFNEES